MPDAYLICTAPRSGSTLLCDLLRQTGVAGWPESFFRQLSVPAFCDEFGLPRQDGEAYDKAYVNAALDASRRGGTLAGLRFMWNAMHTFERRLQKCFDTTETGAKLHAEILGPTRYILLERKEKLAQAVSRARAEQSGLWHMNRDGSIREQIGPAQTPVYDPKLIRRFLEEQTADIDRWTAWFDANEVTPLRLTYEDLSSSPQAVAARVLDFVGRDPAAASALVPGTAKLADDISQEWADRFRQQDEGPRRA